MLNNLPVLVKLEVRCRSFSCIGVRVRVGDYTQFGETSCRIPIRVNTSQKMQHNNITHRLNIGTLRVNCHIDTQYAATGMATWRDVRHETCDLGNEARKLPTLQTPGVRMETLITFTVQSSPNMNCMYL